MPLSIRIVSGFVSTVAVAFIAISSISMAPAEAANVKEIQVDLAKYCKSLKKHYGGWSPERKAFTCADQAIGFNTIYLRNFQNINLTTVCRKYHKTDKWRFHGKQVWCLIPDGVSLQFCNRRDETVWTAMASFVHPQGRRAKERGWVSSGWWKIEPGQCRSLWNNHDYRGDVYVYANTRTSVITGSDNRFCIDNAGSFSISESDKTACKGGKLKKVGMTRFNTRKGMNTWNF